MKRWILTVGLLSALTAACGGGSPLPTNLASPSPVVDMASAGIFKPTMFTGCTAKSIVWDPKVYGRVTVTNGSTPCDFLFVVWNANDYDNQINLAEAGHAFAPNETFTLTLNYAITCGTRYQRDLYVGVKPSPAGQNRYTESDLRNYMYAASGVFAYGPACDAPPPPPPPTIVTHVDDPPPSLCEDELANNLGESLPCTYDSHDHNPPPSVLWCHVADLHSGVVENTLSIPQSAIDGGHVGHNGSSTDVGYPHANWQDEYDYPGTCDGRSLAFIPPPPSHGHQ